ncbi:hypothetical protein [Jannaschia formosa]|uniref:hypothetical protein n=1 Tax=Jannaschia formosa TaxID=2259592 RepID=UPI000E1C0CB0|nr:hypothetical protein [Jannaschia formosa]TFL19521.1 hypothetical protein DR046_03165 [Jannaschia formosa]
MVRVPPLGASPTDRGFQMEREMTMNAVNGTFRGAETSPMAGIPDVKDRPHVLSGFLNERRPVVVDALPTVVAQGTYLRLHCRQETGLRMDSMSPTSSA